MDTNAKGPMKLIAEVLKRSGWENVQFINVGSECAMREYEAHSVYGASKAALAAFTRHLALEVADAGHKIINFHPDQTISGMNEQGRDPSVVADLLVRYIKGQIEIPNGGDMNVWDYVPKETAASKA